MKYNLIVVLIGFLILTSCSTRKEIVYFQGSEKLENMKSLMEFEPVFEVNDILHVKVSSLNEEVVAPFQMTTGGQSQGGGGQQNPSLMGYMVDVDGNIQFPVLGKVPAAGRSRSELESYLTEEIKTYVTDPVVAVRLLNFRVVVLGETGESVVQVENERISVPELLATVGGITYDGMRDNILIIREVDGVKTIGRVDMTSTDVFSNPFYYLKQNDIVYVEPTLRKVKSAGFITSYTGLLSLGTTIFSLIILFTR
ncbi:polysaccharide biosynthesis/export family protein [Gillisia limnaea]|uniref:Polysaccharide export protein n=1 Tax=Gillisia limnaea (strain DSM 15749 / LMG 21470 / R-8282) TaxID=865937 RepID=H2BRK0_GILLR|nr:polysaccharide biosynthesis/export family protein [Gillisia limnaea]EHQ04519.1 polysaccharide export protein [Gillisia limnaea DSM 15749]